MMIDKFFILLLKFFLISLAVGLMIPQLGLQDRILAILCLTFTCEVK